MKRYRHHPFILLGYPALTPLMLYSLVREFSRAIPTDDFDLWQLSNQQITKSYIPMKRVVPRLPLLRETPDR